MAALAMTPQARVMAIKSAKIIRMFAPMAATPRVLVVLAFRRLRRQSRQGALEEN
jgi:hypothetical protein